MTTGIGTLTVASSAHGMHILAVGMKGNLRSYLMWTF